MLDFSLKKMGKIALTLSLACPNIAALNFLELSPSRQKTKAPVHESRMAKMG